MRMSALALLLAVLAGCGGEQAQPACGLNAVVGPTMLLSEFGTPRQTLGTPPANLPEQLVARLAAGPAYSAIVGRADSVWVIGVNGTLPEGVQLSFGVLVLDREGTPRGVLLYESPVIENAPHIGTVTMGASVVPLLGIQLDPARIEDPRCPLFPDSLLQP